MTHYKAIITETSPQEGLIVGNTKRGQFKGMTKEQLLIEAQKTTCFTISVFEI